MKRFKVGEKVYLVSTTLPLDHTMVVISGAYKAPKNDKDRRDMYEVLIRNRKVVYRYPDFDDSASFICTRDDYIKYLRKVKNDNKKEIFEVARRINRMNNEIEDKIKSI